MNLLRLPFVVLIEVFKNMNFKEKFLISLLSKRAKNTMKITSGPSEFSLDFSHVLQIVLMHSYKINSRKITKVTTEWGCCIGGELIELSFHRDRVILQNKSKQMLLVNHVLDVFSKSTISVCFAYLFHPPTVLKIMKMINQQRLNIKSFNYYDTQSELAREILDECTEVTDNLKIYIPLPDDFIYMPPRPFKAIRFYGDRMDHWLNLVFDFRQISFKFDEKVNRSAQFWNTFFRNWRNGRLQCFTGNDIKYSEYRLMMEGLIDGGTKTRLDDEWFEVKRGDGAEFVFRDSSLHFSHIMTKQAFLEYSKKGEFYKSVNFPPYY